VCTAMSNGHDLRLETWSRPCECCRRSGYYTTRTRLAKAGPGFGSRCVHNGNNFNVRSYKVDLHYRS